MSDTAPAPYGRGRKVAIVGFAKPHREQAPWDDPEWEIWGVNDAWSFMPRADRWFEVHNPWIYEWELRRAKGHLDWLRHFGARGGIVYLLKERSDMPHAQAYPFDEVCAALWPERATEGDHQTSRPYLTSSIAYMQALAIAEGFEHIAIYGVDMAADSEYADQRPACEYLLGLAKGRGSKIALPEGCGLLKGPLYGRGEINDGGERISPEQLSGRLRRLEGYELQAVANCDRALALCNQIEGAIRSARDMLNERPADGPWFKARVDNLEGQLVIGRQQLAQHQMALNNVRGALTECRYWIGLTPQGGDPRVLPPVSIPDTHELRKYAPPSDAAVGLLDAMKNERGTGKMTSTDVHPHHFMRADGTVVGSVFAERECAEGRCPDPAKNGNARGALEVSHHA